MEHFYHSPEFGEQWFAYTNLYRHVVEYFPDGSHFVEIGSWKGRSASFMAVEILNSGKNIKFDCIDIWESSDYYSKVMAGQGYPNFLDNLYDTFLKNIAPVSHAINPIRLDSVAASEKYKDQSLDFVFIDGDHSYEGAKRDLQSWLPKVKTGGILAGDDYSYVSKAVGEVLKKGDLNDPWGAGCFMIKIER